MNLQTLHETPPWEWPPDAGKTIRKILMNQREAESRRLIAAELAGELVAMSDELAADLLALLQRAEEPEQLRAQAAIALGPVLELADTDGFDEPDDLPITERTFGEIRDSLHKLYLDTGLPKEVRRRILEASVRAPDAWHEEAVRQAYSSGDREWMLTAVFCMRWVRGFEAQILEALKSADPEIHVEAVHAAGGWEMDAAWPHVVELVQNTSTPKPLLLAAIGAVGGIRAAEAGGILLDLADSEDEEIAEAADEAISMAEGFADAEDDEEDEWIN